jgi:SulP family sulfate permease
VPLHFAVLLGVALSIVMYVVRASSKVRVKEWALQEGAYPIERDPPAQAPSHRFTLLYLYGSLFFASANTVEEQLPRVDESECAVVALVVRGESEMGSTFINLVRRYSLALQARGGRLMLVGVAPEVRAQLAKTGALYTIGEENVFLATDQIGAAVNAAAAAAREWLARQAPAA